MKRRRLQGTLGLAVYVAAVVIVPAAHLAHHAAAATLDHTHGGAIELPSAAPDLVALGLEDVGAPAVVDCSLAALTLADCDTPSHSTRRFGDAAMRDQVPAIPPLDPRHGAGSLEHLGVSILAQQTFVLPPPLPPETRLDVFARPSPVERVAPLTRRSRGPPSPRAIIS